MVCFPCTAALSMRILLSAPEHERGQGSWLYAQPKPTASLGSVVLEGKSPQHAALYRKAGHSY